MGNCKVTEPEIRIDITWVFGVCGAASLITIAVALDLWGAVEIRGDPGAVIFLTSIGVGWLVIASCVFPWLGLSVVDDVRERSNVAALVALCGALLAVAIIYAGGSVGEGPSYLNNFFCAGLGTIALLVLWILLELGANISMSIAEERDLASGIRLCGFLLASGLMLGRAVAGNWHSAAATIRDFIHDGWPVTILWAIGLAVERIARPSHRRPFPAWVSYGFIPAALYLALASVWLWHVGRWEGILG